MLYGIEQLKTWVAGFEAENFPTNGAVVTKEKVTD